MKKTILFPLFTFLALFISSCQLFPQLCGIFQNEEPVPTSACTLLGTWDVPYYLLQNTQTGETKRVQYGEPTAFYADGTYKQPYGGIGKYEIKDCVLRQDYENKSHYYKISLNTEKETIYTGPYDKDMKPIHNTLYTFFLFKRSNL